MGGRALDDEAQGVKRSVEETGRLGVLISGDMAKIAPGVIHARFHDSMTPETYNNNFENRIPLHSEGIFEEVAQVISIFVENNFIIGETVTIDGGATMRIA